MYLHVREEADKAGNIPLLWVLPENGEKEIVLVYYHGWGSDVESSRFRASLWAAADYPVLVVEEALHGVRGSWDYEDMAKLPYVVFENMKEFSAVLARVKDRYPHKKIVVCGHSMGGITAMGLLSQEGVSGAIALNGAGDWQAMERDPYKDAVAVQNPILRTGEHKDKAICMLNGELDDVVNPRYQQNYYEKIKTVHEGREPLVFEIIEGTSHVVTTNMMAITLDFLEKM
ncbi:MAG: alpha/beta hydrolase [Peptoniphilus sp.]|nr:alpha/beta hydrolase [Peptoniphilus sp.]MDY3118158.1 alpha/beta hydrolase [Peptoniphilus sp.]